MILYHGGAPGFQPGDLIEPHPTRHVDGCEWCASGSDDNHRPDRVFATTLRLYGKFYASKFLRGWLYVVQFEGPFEPSDDDPFECYHGGAVRVLRVSERSVELTMNERRRLWRLWGEDDRVKGRPQMGFYQRLAFERQIGLAR